MCGEAANFQSRNLRLLILGFWRGLKCFNFIFQRNGRAIGSRNVL